MAEKEEKCRCGLAVWKHEVDYDTASAHLLDEVKKCAGVTK
jgi:hypothetical protein